MVTPVRVVGLLNIVTAHLASVCVSGLSVSVVHAQALQVPLPVELSIPSHEHVGRPPVNLSPDGRWVAHTYSSGEPERFDEGTVGFAYSPTGVPPLGGMRPHARLTEVETGETVELGDPRGSSWAPVWSPDGERVAFYSDQDGEAGLWVWGKRTRRATRFPGVIVRPYFGWEAARWSHDSRYMLVKILAEGMTVAQANTRINQQATRSESPSTESEEEPSVTVRRFPVAEAAAGTPAAAPRPRSISEDVVDLALLDTERHTVTRIVERVAILWYAFSPDGRRVAYVQNKGLAPSGVWWTTDLVIVDLATGRSNSLVEDVPFRYGLGVSWSPDGRYLAYVPSGPSTAGDCVVVSVEDGRSIMLGGDHGPSFDQGDDRPPLWDAVGENIITLADGKLWRLDATGEQGPKSYRVPGRIITGVVSPHGGSVAWSGGDRGHAWVVTRSEDSLNSGIWRIDLESGESHPAVEEIGTYSGQFYNLDAVDSPSRIALVAEDVQRTAEIWTLDISSKRLRRATHLNAASDRYALGTTRLIEWTTVDGGTLKGTLLLPPDYSEDRRYPLVVWVYGSPLGELTGSNAASRFALGWGTGTFNFHVLATRGYAVLYPDTPLRQGRQISDLTRTVIPAVDRAIDLGIADPERLAVMGQSYGSYSALALITQTQRFKAAVISAVSLHPDLVSAYVADPFMTGYFESGQGNLGGTPWEYRERYLANSPIYFFDRIATPLLMAHGTRDSYFPGDPLAAPNSIFTALQRLEKQVELRVYEGEGHVLQRKANVIDFWHRRLEFLAEHLDIALDDTGAILFEDVSAKSRN